MSNKAHEKTEKKTWWRQSRFGMFIHWGLYSVMARGEWVMYVNRIPVKEYEKLADEFNPVDFDADEWVKTAKNAGMKYIVFTTKHHDGFSMFKTDVNDYNIVVATPFKRDVTAELAQACEKNGIRLCFYYSHVREWRHPHAQSLEMHSPNHFGNYGNFWDYPDEYEKNLQIYVDEFDKPQIRELLTQYGPVGILWFDTPSLIRPDQAQELVDLVRGLQPDCLINSRVGKHVDFDYHSLGDNEVPDFNTGVDFETPMTICDFWGYNAMPGNRYRDVREIIHQLVDIVSLGGNYLLNVGPDAKGRIPTEARERLAAVGDWMRVNGEAIYATNASPFPAKPSWGRITAGDDTLYLHVYEWRKSITLTGLKSGVKSMQLLARPEQKITWTREACGSLGYDKITINLPAEAPDQVASVVEVRFEAGMEIESGIIEDEYGLIELPACLSSIHSQAGKPRAKVGITGVVNNWLSTEDWFGWDFLCEHPGVFEATVTIGTGFHGIWDFGHEVVVECDGRENHLRIEDSGAPTGHFQKRTFDAGKITVSSVGRHRISIKALRLSSTNRQGFQLTSIRLTPAHSTVAETTS